MSQKASATLQRQSFVRQKSSFPDKPMILQSFSGIFRSVYLYTMPKVHVYDLKVQPVVDEAVLNADLLVTMQMRGEGKARLTLTGSRNYSVLEEKEEQIIFSEELPVSEGEVHFEKEVKKPDLWSAEIPNLYTLTIECLDQNGERSELVSQRIGFRRFEMKDGIMTLNGKRIVFKGVNRHEFSSKTGRAVTREEVLKEHHCMFFLCTCKYK